MTREEAIRILDPETSTAALTEIEYYNGFSGHVAQVEAVNEACKIAVAAMRRITELESHSKALENNPLTIEELRQMDGEPVWVEHYNGGEWVTVHWNYEDCIATAYNACLRMSGYGESWIAYRRKPETAEKP